MLVAFSAGPDSTAMLHLLLKARDKYNLTILLAYVNDLLRKDSMEEERFVKSWAEKLGLQLFSITLNPYKSNQSIEEIGRKVRYDFFKKIAKKKILNNPM